MVPRSTSRPTSPGATNIAKIAATMGALPNTSDAR